MNSKHTFQVCISDNCSTDDTEEVVQRAKNIIDIKYNKNLKNVGIPQNFLNVVDMADGEFVWLLGDDDLLLPNAIDDLYSLIECNTNIDFFYVNSFHLTAEYISSFPKPFDTKYLPDNMKPFSSFDGHGEMNFWDLINPKVSFDFLGGMYLSVFRRSYWKQNTNLLDKEAINDLRTFSHFDNTFPHVKIFSKAFANKKAYFSSKPLSVNLAGVREWSALYPLVHSVRLVEALAEYRKNGMPFLSYLRCKNYALNNFIPDLVSMYLNRQKSGFYYIKPLKLIIHNFIYPNFYLSVIYFIIRKIKSYFKTLLYKIKIS